MSDQCWSLSILNFTCYVSGVSAKWQGNLYMLILLQCVWLRARPFHDIFAPFQIIHVIHSHHRYITWAIGHIKSPTDRFFVGQFVPTTQQRYDSFSLPNPCGNPPVTGRWKASPCHDIRVTLYARLTLIVVSRRPSQTIRTQRLNNTGGIHLCGILINDNCLLSYQQVHILSDQEWWLISGISSLIMTMGCQNLAGLA